ncbi:questin oxidase family protein [Massilia horti]|uniref:DUF4243 domain-containing protein n=1 Tax=Massilia horti TaxID=2562153 RepID=A0A4Y9SMB5_9BURK|nr:questin oxidase family protein [Massilia horti]TFW27581.1 DUF4243 domain-containing protein [Massilia horti]
MGSSISQACSKLLADTRHYAPMYGHRQANHLPMALVALDRLGADPPTLSGFAERYVRRLRLRPAARAALDPHEYLGSADDFARFAAFFEQRISESGLDAVLRDWMPVLMPGLAGAAFHALIRFGYAVDTAIEGEIAHALAFWASEYVCLPLSLDPAQGTLEEIAVRLRSRVASYTLEPGIITDKLLEISWHPALAGPVLQPKEPPGLEQIARFALEAYRKHADFTLLHVLIACHAFRLALPYASDKALALRYMWQGALVAYLTVVPPAQPGEQDLLPDAELTERDIAALAMRAEDDHVTRLCYAALSEWRQYGEPAYLQVAARSLAQAGLLDS